MNIDVVETRRNETRWRGTLTPEQLGRIIAQALNEELCPYHRFGLSLEITAAIQDGSDKLPTVSFELVRDHDWVLKPEAGERAAC